MSLSLSRLFQRVRSSSRGPHLVYVSYHKCASQFVERVLRAVCDAHGLRAETFDSRHPRVPRRALRRADFLLLTDYSSQMVELEALDARGLYVTRDPRDILVSMYHSHRFSHALTHPEIGRNRLALADMDLAAGLRYLVRESELFRRIIKEMGAWSERGLGYHETTFERLTGDPSAEFGAALSALDLAVEPGLLASILEANAFEKLRAEWARRRPEAQVNHYREGKSGGWRTQLTGSAAAEFDERYGALMTKLGYGTTVPG